MLDFGLEIEFVTPNRVPQVVVADALNAAGVQTWASGSYNHIASPDRWKVVGDGSVVAGAGMVGHELVSPVLNETTGPETVRKVCGVLAALDATVNKTCGLHVHFTASNLPTKALRELAKLYVQHETLIDQLVPPSRRGTSNYYCQSNKAKVKRQLLDRATTVREISQAVQNEDRRHKLNFQSYFRHGTVEFRQAAGTVNAERILKWVGLCSKIVETAIKDAAVSTTVSNSGYSPRWQKGRRYRLMFQMLTRPEGATDEEIRVALGVRNPPGVLNHLNRTNAVFAEDGYRGYTGWGRVNSRYKVYKLVPGAVTAPAAPASSLQELFTKLELSEEEKAFWTARAEALRDAQTVRNAPWTAVDATVASPPAEPSAAQLYDAIHGDTA